jgi:hypothetical protein
VAVFTEGFSGNLNFNLPYRNRAPHIEGSPVPFHWSPAMIAALAAVTISVFVLAMLIFYLLVRLRFALFYCLIHQTKLIRPGWRLYRAQARRFFLLGTIVGLAFFAIFAAVCLPFVFGALHLYRDYQSSGQFPFARFFALLLPFIPVFLLMIFAAIAVNVILRDFMLPHIALENASGGQAWAAVRARITREKGSFLLYTVLRVALSAAAFIAVIIVLAIPLLILFGGLAIVMVALHAAFSNFTGAAWVLGASLEVLIGLTVVAVGLLAAISFGGPISIAIRNYSLVFYGSRYQVLGDILFPPAPPPAVQPGVA